MQITKTHKIILSIIAITLLFGAYVYLDRRSGNEATNPVATTTTTTATSTGINVTVKGPDGYTIEQVPLDEGVGVPQPIPNLNRPVTMSLGAVVSAEASLKSIEKVKTLQESLKKNPADFSSWLELGIYQKMGGDYEGASITWQYAARLAPTDHISRGDLGNLYGYYIRDNGKAEVYYKDAIRVATGPAYSYLYIQLAEVYRDLFKDISKAKVTIDQGLGKFPNDAGLLQFKASLQ